MNQAPSTSAPSGVGEGRGTTRSLIRASRCVPCGVCCALLVGMSAAGQSRAQTSKETEQLPKAVKFLHDTRKGDDPKAPIEDRVRHMTWLLLVGELAADPNVGLSSGASDTLER